VQVFFLLVWVNQRTPLTPPIDRSVLPPFPNQSPVR